MFKDKENFMKRATARKCLNIKQKDCLDLMEPTTLLDLTKLKETSLHRKKLFPVDFAYDSDSVEDMLKHLESDSNLENKMIMLTQICTEIRKIKPFVNKTKLSKAVKACSVLLDEKNDLLNANILTMFLFLHAQFPSTEMISFNQLLNRALLFFAKNVYPDYGHSMIASLKTIAAKKKVNWSPSLLIVTDSLVKISNFLIFQHLLEFFCFNLSDRLVFSLSANQIVFYLASVLEVESQEIRNYALILLFELIKSKKGLFESYFTSEQFITPLWFNIEQPFTFQNAFKLVCLLSNTKKLEFIHRLLDNGMLEAVTRALKEVRHKSLWVCGLKALLKILFFLKKEDPDQLSIIYTSEITACSDLKETLSALTYEEDSEISGRAKEAYKQI